MLSLAIVAHADAQQVGAQSTAVKPYGRIETKVVLTENGLGGQPAVVLRRPPQEGGDVIVLSARGANPQLFAAAATALTRMRDASGDTVFVNSMRAIRSSPRAPDTELKASQLVLSKLRSSSLQEVTGLGEARVTVVYLPNREGRRVLKSRQDSRSPH